MSDDPLSTDPDNSNSSTPLPLRFRRPVMQTLACSVLRRSLTSSQARRLRATGSLAFVIEAPGPTWVVPLAVAIRQVGCWDHVFAQDGSDRKHRADQGNDDVAAALSLGQRVVGIAPAPRRHLPSVLVGAADLQVRVVVSDAAIRDALVRCCGERPRAMPPGAWAGLDIHDLAAAIRSGDGTDIAITRMRAAVSARAIVDADVAEAPPFDALHGYGDAKAWGQNLIDDVAAWRAGKLDFSAISTRAVLASPPGLGKTTFVRSLAKAVDLPLVATSVASWFTDSAGYLDSVVKQIDVVFSTARARAPSILFLDELDAVPNRASLDGRSASWWVPVVTHILLSLDSTTSGANGKIITIGATNFFGKLDAALVRPGRLDRIIHISMPDEAARAGILAGFCPDIPPAGLLQAARLASGTTGADLMQAVKTARRAARVAGRALAIQDLVDAVAPPDARKPTDIWTAAVHESGHVVARVAAGCSIDEVSIVARDGTGGFVTGQDFGATPCRETLDAMVVSLLAGRAAETVVIGHASVGAGGPDDSDLARATGLLAAIHGSYGLGASGLLWRGSPYEAARLLAVDPGLRSRVEADLVQLYQRALALMKSERKIVEEIARALVRTRHLTGVEVAVIIEMTSKRLNRAEGADV